MPGLSFVEDPLINWSRDTRGVIRGHIGVFTDSKIPLLLNTHTLYHRLTHYGRRYHISGR